ncbi:MAG: hypothetical protein E8A46_19395 [Bradyrhizobium sp.]|nr:MAG: hypothetical protein E8A46_19395 [Bradyrhizobium sp.]
MRSRSQPERPRSISPDGTRNTARPNPRRQAYHETVIASGAKQSSFLKNLDCFVASLLAMTGILSRAPR